MLKDELAAAIEDLKPSFEADSFGVELESVNDAGDVVIAIVATPDACLDCLVPDGILEQIVTAAVRRRAPAAAEVSVVKRNFELLS